MFAPCVQLKMSVITSDGASVSKPIKSICVSHMRTKTVILIGWFHCQCSNNLILIISLNLTFWQTLLQFFIIIRVFFPLLFHCRPHSKRSRSGMKTKMLRWQSCYMFCLFNLRPCDITRESWGGTSCHWGTGSTSSPLFNTGHDLYNQYLSVSLRWWNTISSQWVPHGSARVRDGNEGPSLPEFQNHDLLKSAGLMTGQNIFWIRYFVNILLLLCCVCSSDYIRFPK